MTLLSNYLRLAASRPFIWGTCDCCLFVADWICLARGLDPASDLRGRYASQRGACRLIKREGGLLALMEVRMGLVGFAKTIEPWAGDIGLVQTELGETASIRTEIGWACKSPHGLIVASFPLLMSWKL